VTAARLIGLALAGSLLWAQSASLVIRNARVWTGDPQNPWADSVAAAGELITIVGKVPAGIKLSPGGRIIDAGGRLVTPGFIDSHVHFIEAGARMSSVQLRSAKTREEFVARIRKFAAGKPEGTWITGGDWDHENWGGELPERQWIDAATPKHPVWITRLDGHMGLANSLALKLAKVSRESMAVAGGTIVRTAAGEPTGILKDNAMELVERARPELGPAEVSAAIEAASGEMLRNGVTTVHHMGAATDLDHFQSARVDGKLKVRVYVAFPFDSWKPIDKLTFTSYGDRWIRWGLLKAFLDGSLGSRTAAFDKPYSDNPDNSGFLVTSPQALFDRMYVLESQGLFSAVHAIGDRANRILLNVIEEFEKTRPNKDHRFRVEHAQHLHPADIARFAKLGVIASMQPYHVIDDGRWAEKAIGPERAKTAYAFRSLLDAGAILAFGSDWFVAPPSVMEGIYAAVTRRTLDGKHPGGWIPEQKIKVEEALRAYTYGGAYAAVEETAKGMIKPGMIADFAILGQDITKIEPEKIRDVNVVMTVVGGEVAFEQK